MINACTSLPRAAIHRHPLLTVAAGVFLSFTAVSSQDSEAPDDGSRFAHVRFVSGEADLVRAFDGDMVPLVLNLPIIAGDRLEAGARARLELGLADGSLLRAQGPLVLDVHALSATGEGSESLTLLELHRGDLSLEITGMDQSPDKAFQVDTPSGTCYLMTDGLYRVSVEQSGSAMVTVRAGVAEVSGDGGTSLVRSGQTSLLASGRAPERPASHGLRTDDFDRWIDERSTEALASLPPEAEDLPDPVRPYAEDLTRYGTWQTVPEYGMVWFPADVPVGWYPYYDGTWVTSPSGHLWVSYEPWGWIPYHYGRWEYVAGGGWFWIPGPVFAGAWVHWWVGPSYVSWVPLGYNNGPVIDLSLSLSFHRAPFRGWACVPYHEFHSSDLPHKYVRDARVMKAHLNKSVRVRRLPDFHPRHLRTGSDFGNEIVQRARGSRDDLPRRRFHSAGVRARPASGTDRGSHLSSTRQSNRRRSIRMTTMIQVQSNRRTSRRGDGTTGTPRQRTPVRERGRSVESRGTSPAPAPQTSRQARRQGRRSSERGVADLLRRVTRTPAPRRATSRRGQVPRRPQPRSVRSGSPSSRNGAQAPQVRNSSKSRSRKQGTSAKSVRSRSGKKVSTGSRPKARKSSSGKAKRSNKPKPRPR
ncbi:MAG: DUF6600 domain-containing protein [Acidobacteriota bacterium]